MQRTLQNPVLISTHAPSSQPEYTNAEAVEPLGLHCRVHLRKAHKPRSGCTLHGIGSGRQDASAAVTMNAHIKRLNHSCQLLHQGKLLS